MRKQTLSLRWWFGIVSLAVLCLTLIVQTESKAAETGEFIGTWVANGVRELFPFSDERKVYTFRLSGHVNLETDIGKKNDYWAKCVGLSDSETGVVARCVWQDLSGPEIFITLKSDRLQKDHEFTGTIIGGTEHLEGITGELSFIWSSVFVQKKSRITTVTGQTLNLKGTYQIP